MDKILKLLLLLLFSVSYAHSRAQGLRFLNPIDSINGRTSYSVFADDERYFFISWISSSICCCPE